MYGFLFLPVETVWWCAHLSQLHKGELLPLQKFQKYVAIIRSSLIHFACIGVTPPRLFKLQAWIVEGELLQWMQNGSNLIYAILLSFSYTSTRFFTSLQFAKVWTRWFQTMCFLIVCSKLEDIRIVVMGHVSHKAFTLWKIRKCIHNIESCCLLQSEF